MYRVLIADDESSVIQSLLASLDWSALDLELAAVAANGEEALRLVEGLDIDIALLDIRMPGISGLELCERLRAVNSRIQLILISGFAEFAYAEKAIQYGVIAYCLKPLDYEKVTRALLKASGILHSLDHTDLRENLPDLISSQEDSAIQEVLTAEGMPGAAVYVAVSAGGNRLSFSTGAGLALRLGREKWGYLLKSPPMDAWLLKQGRLSGCSGLGALPEAVRVTELKASLELCGAMACSYFIEPGLRICHDCPDSRADEWFNRIHQRIREGSWNRISAVLREIRDTAMLDFTARSALRLCNLICSVPLFRDAEKDHYLYSIDQMIAEYGTFSAMLESLCGLIESAGIPLEGGSFTNTAFMKLLLYINQNYRTDISLTSAAAALHMTPNYISQLFKKETGDTFVHYITEKRLNDAKKLLLTTQKPVTDIAIEVGFNDYFYFSRIFRKNFDLTPSQFREQR